MAPGASLNVPGGQKLQKVESSFSEKRPESHGWHVLLKMNVPAGHMATHPVRSTEKRRKYGIIAIIALPVNDQEASLELKAAKSCWR